MHDPELVWRFGKWIANRTSGTAHFGWTEGEMTLRLRRGNVVSILGLDPDAISRLVECEPIGNVELLEEARQIAAERGVPDTQTLGAAKEVLQEAMARWILDSERSLQLIEEDVEHDQGPTISPTHAIVELILADMETDYVPHVLPDFTVILHRAPNFLELYSPLRLSEDADLMVAKITGQRTADEIGDRSSSGAADVGRLLAALTATGMIEPVPANEADDDIGALDLVPPIDEPERKTLPVAWIAGAAAILAVLLAFMMWLVLKPEPVETPEPDVTWTLVVDMGCEPEELQRVLKKARQYPEVLRPVQANTGDDNPCWRLVWGRFPNREAAEQGAADLPESLRMDGFEPHAIELPEEAEQADEE